MIELEAGGGVPLYEQLYRQLAEEIRSGQRAAGTPLPGRRTMAGELGVKNGTLLWPVRIAAAGTLVTPGGAMEILALLGREEALRRLKLGLAKLQG